MTDDEQVRHIADDAAHDAKDNRARLLAVAAVCTSVVAIVFLVVTLWTDRSTAEDERDVAEAVTAEAAPVIQDVDAICAAGGKPAEALRARGACDDVDDVQAAIDEAEVQESEVDQPEPDDPDPNDPDPDDPERQNPERQDAEPDDAEPDDADPDSPDPDDPETQEDEAQDGEIDNPDPTDDPDPDDPEIQDDEIQDEEIDQPEPDDQPVSPYPFTFDFTVLGMTFVCTIDSPTDNTCDPG